MALVRPLNGEMGTVLIVGSNVLRMPGERRHAFENGLECLHIQGKSWNQDFPIMFTADEFYAPDDVVLLYREAGTRGASAREEWEQRGFGTRRLDLQGELARRGFAEQRG